MTLHSKFWVFLLCIFTFLSTFKFNCLHLVTNIFRNSQSNAFYRTLNNINTFKKKMDEEPERTKRWEGGYERTW